jgi:hypothetical protein
MNRRQTEKMIAAISGLTAINAIGGAIYGLNGAPNVPREWLEGSPFPDYRIPSLTLGVAVGGSSAVSAAAAWRGSDHAGPAAVCSGGVLTAWIIAQVMVIGPRSFLQPLMGGAGLATIGLGARLSSRHSTSFRRLAVKHHKS